MKKIETERLILRPFESRDLEDMFEYCKDERVGPMAGWPPHKTIEDTREILKEFIGSNEVYAIYVKDDEKVIGSIGLHKRNPNNKFDTEIGYVLSPGYWGRGYMPEAVKAVITYLFTYTDCMRISVGHFSTNYNSKRVIEKCGFIHEGTIRKSRITLSGEICDSVKYSILKEEFENNQLNWQKEI